MDDRENLPDYESLTRCVRATSQNQFVEFTEKQLLYLPNQRQTGVGGEIVGEFFDNKVGHVVLTFWVNTILHLSR